MAVCSWMASWFAGLLPLSYQPRCLAVGRDIIPDMRRWWSNVSGNPGIGFGSIVRLRMTWELGCIPAGCFGSSRSVVHSAKKEISAINYHGFHSHHFVFVSIQRVPCAGSLGDYPILPSVCPRCEFGSSQESCQANNRDFKPRTAAQAPDLMPSLKLNSIRCKGTGLLGTRLDFARRAVGTMMRDCAVIRIFPAPALSAVICCN